MGLGFSNCRAHFSYSGFMNFRNKLVETLGYTHSLNSMYNDGTYVNMKTEPIFPLIDHSDCDGGLTVEEMKQILPQLKCIVGKWPKDDYEKTRGLELVEGMEISIELNEPMVFC